MAIEIVDFPMNSMVIFHGKMLVHQRVIPMKTSSLYLPQTIEFNHLCSPTERYRLGATSCTLSWTILEH